MADPASPTSVEGSDMGRKPSSPTSVKGSDHHTGRNLSSSTSIKSSDHVTRRNPASPTSVKSSDHHTWKNPASPTSVKSFDHDTGRNPSSPMSVKSSDIGRKSRSPPISPRSRILRSQFSRTDSSFSGNESIRRRRTSSVSSMKRRASLSLPHSNAFKFLDERKIEELQKEEEKHDFSQVPWWTSKRLCLSGICFLGFFCLYAQRVNLSVAIVCMIRQNTQLHTSPNSSSVVQPIPNSSAYLYTFNNTDDNNHTVQITSLQCPETPFKSSDGRGEFEWEKPLQGFILGAFFWGYTAMQIPSGWLSERFGPRLIISIGMFCVSILTIMTPLFARASPYLLLIARVLIGVGEATMYPGAQALWAKWSPPDERSRLVGFAFGGCQLGNALAFPIAGVLCDYGFDGGWPSVFYVIGTLAFLWCVLWVTCVRNTPREMPGILPIETEYIEFTLGMGNDQEEKPGEQKKHEPKPWKEMLTSGAMWAILVANACGNYGAYMLLTQMPTYMKEVLHFDIKSNGVFSMIPYLVFWVFVILAGNFADFFISKEILSIEWTRKMCCSIGMFLPAVFLVITGHMDCWNQTAAVVLLTLSMAFCGFQFSSFFINHGDIAPKFAGTIFGITNTGASIPGILAPYVVSAVTQNKSQGEWLTAFYIAAVIYCCGAIFYIIFAKGDIQPWAKFDNDREDNVEMKMIDIRGIIEEDNVGKDYEDSVFIPNAEDNVVEKKRE